MAGGVQDEDRRLSVQKNEGYCVRCKQKTMMQDAEEVTMKNGRPAVRGTCPQCGTRMYRILPKKMSVDI